MSGTIGEARLEGRELDEFVHHFFLNGAGELHSEGMQEYSEALCEFLCSGWTPGSTCQEVLCKFAAKQAGEGLRPRTINAYLSEERLLHIEGMADPFVQPLH